MSVRSVVVRLEAEVSRFLSGMAKSQKATEEAAKAQEALGKAAEEAAKKTSQSTDKPAQDLAKLAKAHQDAAKAAGLHYNELGQLVDGNKRVLTSAQATAHGLETFSDAVYKTGFEAEQAAEAQKRAADEVEKAATKHQAASEKAGAALLAFGAVSVAALGASAKAAMDWESAWAGVNKTVDGTPEQMAELETGLRGLAKTLPATHEEIAGVAEAAGQLGVKRADILGFTKTMIDLGVSTNLTAEDAATNIAQISNVMGTMNREGSEGVSRFGAALVALGNDGASTEAEILSMAQRIAGAGATVGATETDVLALANTLASMGVNAELGGGVTTRVLLKIFTAVKDGGKKMEAFAKTAGVSGEEFAKAFEDSPIKAMDLVTKGLARVNGEGGNVVSTMKELGIKGTEEVQVMLALANSGDLLSDSLELGAKAWKDNTALTDEAGKRYETTSSKVKVALNNIKDASIDAGAVMLPMLQSVAEGVSGLAQGFGNLPAPAQGAITILAGVTGGAALLTGGLLTVIPKIRDTKESLEVLAPAGSKANAALSRTGKIAAGAAIGLTAVATAATLAGPALDKVLKPTGETGDALERFAGQAAQGAVGADTLSLSFQDLVQHKDGVSDFQTAIDGIADPGVWGNIDNVLTGTINVLTLGMADMNSTSEEARDRFKAMGTELASLSSEKAAAAFQSMAAQTDGSKASLSRLLEFMPDYRRKLEEQAKAAGTATDDQSLLNLAMTKADPAAKNAARAQEILDKSLQDTGVALGGVVEDMDKFLEQLFKSGQITMSARDANAAYNDALRGIPEAMKQIADSGGKMGRTLNDTATDFDLTTEAGALANDAYQTLARRGMAEVEAMSKEGIGQDELQAKLNTTYTDLVENAKGMGLGKEAAEALARSVLGVPDGVDITTWMADTARIEAEKTKKAIEDIPAYKRVTIDTVENIQRNYDTSSGNTGKPGSIAGMAEGGAVYGGTAGVDSVPIMAMPGEHMFTDEEVRIMGGQQAVYRFRDGLRKGKIPGYANGGAVGTVASSVSVMPTFHAPKADTAGPLTMTGTLVADTGELLGMFRGVANHEANTVIDSRARASGRQRGSR